MKRNPGNRLAVSVMLTGACVYFSLCSPVLAQSATGGVPVQTNPGLIIPSPNEQVREQQQRTEQKEIPLEKQNVPPSNLEVPQPSASVQLHTTKFMANTITVENVTILTDKEIKAVTDPYIGKEISFDDLENIVNQINTLYRDKGYLTSQAYVPPQEIEQGNVRIAVVEGKVGEVCVLGNHYYRPSVIRKKLKLEPGEAFDLKALEKSLNRSNQTSNYALKAVLAPGENTGETDVRIEAQERQPWQVTPTFDNQGRPFIGTYRGGVEVNNDSLFGFGDRLLTKYVGAAGTEAVLGSYYVPIGSRGDEIGANFGYSHVDVDLGVPNQPDIDGIAHNIGLTFSHPFTEDRTLVGDIGINGRRIRSLIDNDRTSLDEIRSIDVGLTFDKNDRWGRTFARTQVTTALDILGGNAQFFKTEGFLTRLFLLPMHNILMLRFYGQVTPDALPSAEAFQLGGAYSVRGFTEGVLVGDRGYNLTIEDRWPIPFLHNVSPWLAERLQGATFIDLGQAWLDKSNALYVPGQSSNAEHTLLVGTGVGLRARLTQYLQGFFDVGFGLVDRSAIEPQGDPTARIHFGIRSDLLPEKYRKVDTRKKPTCIHAATQTPKVSLACPAENLPVSMGNASEVKDTSLNTTLAPTEEASTPKTAEVADTLPLSPTRDLNGHSGLVNLLESN